MHNARIDSTQDLEGQTVVSACFDLGEEEVAAAVHALQTIVASATGRRTCRRTRFFSCAS